MGKRGSVKMVMPKGAEDSQKKIQELFAQMTGSKDADPLIIIPKYINMINSLRRIYVIFDMLCNFDVFNIHYNEWCLEIRTYITEMKTVLNLDIKNALTESQFYDVPKNEINEKYKFAKNTNFIADMLTINAKLSEHKADLENEKNIRDGFIKKEIGSTFRIFPFTHLDLLVLWGADDIYAVPRRKYTLQMLHHLYRLTFDIYDIYSSPDIDIRELSRSIIENIVRLRKQIPRCDKAFDVIEKSVNMLETNFKQYYRNSVESDNPSIIVDNFLIDITKAHESSPRVIAQFRKILSFMQKNNSNVNNPMAQELFKVANMNLEKL